MCDARITGRTRAPRASLRCISPARSRLQLKVADPVMISGPPLWRQRCREVRVMTDHFPRLLGRDLTGRTQWLPVAFGERLSLVFIAFRRDQQPMIDSWVPWCAERTSRTGWPSARYRSWDGAGRRCARSSMAAWLLRLVTSRRAADDHGLREGRQHRRCPRNSGPLDGVDLPRQSRRAHRRDRATGPFDGTTAARFPERAND